VQQAAIMLFITVPSRQSPNWPLLNPLLLCFWDCLWQNDLLFFKCNSYDITRAKSGLPKPFASITRNTSSFTFRDRKHCHFYRHDQVGKSVNDSLNLFEPRKLYLLIHEGWMYYNKTLEHNAGVK